MKKNDHNGGNSFIDDICHAYLNNVDCNNNGKNVNGNNNGSNLGYIQKLKDQIRILEKVGVTSNNGNIFDCTSLYYIKCWEGYEDPTMYIIKHKNLEHKALVFKKFLSVYNL
ncbi:hypothetical protein ACTFIV_000451 [Dictyostelium citrinum]